MNEAKRQAAPTDPRVGVSSGIGEPRCATLSPRAALILFLRTGHFVGQSIAFHGLLPRVFGPRNLLKHPVARCHTRQYKALCQGSAPGLDLTELALGCPAATSQNLTHWTLAGAISRQSQKAQLTGLFHYRLISQWNPMRCETRVTRRRIHGINVFLYYSVSASNGGLRGSTYEGLFQLVRPNK